MASPSARSELARKCADAAALFSSSKITEAAASWHGILRQLLPHVTTALASANGDAITGATPGPTLLLRLRGSFTAHPLSEAADSALGTSLTSGDRTFTVSTSAIQYHPGACVATAGLEDDVLVAATAVFNLGLCHHLQALLHGDRATACYERALRAYDSSQRILEAAGLLGCLTSERSDPPHRHTRLLIFALTNNVGHVFDQFHEHAVAHQQLELLHFLVASLGRTMTTDEVASDAGPFTPFVLTAALHPCHRGRGACLHPAPCAHKPRNRRAMETPTTRKEIESMRADAVILFSTGHIQEASRMWHGVVRRLLPLVMGALSEPGEAVEEAAVPAPRLNGEFWVHFPGDVTRSPSSSSSKIASGDRAFAVYASALEYVVNPRFDQTLYDDLALAATSVFNLGLCHHLQALLLPGGGGTRDATKSYEKALRRAYGASQRVMDESGLGTFLEAASHQRHGLGLLQLALANNVGHIHDQMHSHDGVRQQLLTLHGLLLLSSPPLDRPLANAAPSPLSTSIEAWLDLYAPFLLTAALYPDCDKACQPAPCA